jgi:hypothetical protein
LMLKEADIQNKAKIVEKQMTKQWTKSFKSTTKSASQQCPLKGG